MPGKTLQVGFFSGFWSHSCLRHTAKIQGRIPSVTKRNGCFTVSRMIEIWKTLSYKLKNQMCVCVFTLNSKMSRHEAIQVRDLKILLNTGAFRVSNKNRRKKMISLFWRKRKAFLSFYPRKRRCARSEKFADCWFDKSHFQGSAGWSIEAPYLTMEPSPNKIAATQYRGLILEVLKRLRGYCPPVVWSTSPSS